MNAQPSHCNGFVATGYPMRGVRVLVTRLSGETLIARLDLKPDAFARNASHLHWLTDNWRFADVGFDPIVSWNPIPSDNQYWE